MSSLRKLTYKQLEKLLDRKRGCILVGLESITQPEFKVGSPFQEGEITKISQVGGLVGDNYQSGVNKQRVKEHKAPDFIADRLPWGTFINKGIILHDNKRYLRIRVQTNSYIYFNTLTKKIVPAEKVDPWLAKKTNYKQGLEKGIHPRNYSLSNIYKIHVFGQKYQYEHEEPIDEKVC